MRDKEYNQLATAKGSDQVYFSLVIGAQMKLAKTTDAKWQTLLCR